MKYKNKRMQSFTFFTNIFLNVDISINVEYKPFNFFEVILDIIMEGTVSQIFYLGLSFSFM